MLGISQLNEITSQQSITSAAELLNLLREHIISSLNQVGSDDITKDGMDISLCIYNTSNRKICFSGANNAVYIVRKPKVESENKAPELLEFKADRMPIGIHIKQNVLFEETIFDIEEGDQLYLTTDGYCDQFDKNNKDKFQRKRFKQTLLDICNLPINEQYNQISTIFEEWKGETEQIDDVTVMGIRF